MSHLSDQPETEKVREYFRYVIDDGGDAKKSWGTAIVLQVPKQEGKYHADAEAHEPGNEEKRGTLQVLKMGQDSHPFGDFTHCLREYFTLKRITLVRTEPGVELKCSVRRENQCKPMLSRKPTQEWLSKMSNF